MTAFSPSQIVLHLAACCAPDIPLPKELLQQASGLSEADFNQTVKVLTASGQLLTVPSLGMFLPAEHWQELRQQNQYREIHRQLFTAALEKAQSAMRHHTRLAQLSAMRAVGPHLLVIAELAEAEADAQAPQFWQVLAEYLQAVGKHSEAESCYRRALAVHAALYPSSPDRQWLMEQNLSLGNTCLAQNEFERAGAAFNNALQLADTALAATDPKRIPIYEGLGQLAFKRGHFNEAIECYQQILHIDEVNHSGPNRIAARWNNLGRVYQAGGGLEKAIECFQQAAELWKDSGTSEHHANRALALKNLALVYQTQGKLPEARQTLLDAIICSEEIYGADHPDIGRDASLLGQVLQELGEYPAALEQFQRALAIDQKSFGAVHPEVALAYNSLGVLHFLMGSILQAQQALETARDILTRCAPSDHPYRQQVEENLHNLQQHTNSVQ